MRTIYWKFRCIPSIVQECERVRTNEQKVWVHTKLSHYQEHCYYNAPIIILLSLKPQDGAERKSKSKRIPNKATVSVRYNIRKIVSVYLTHTCFFLSIYRVVDEVFSVLFSLSRLLSFLFALGHSLAHPHLLVLLRYYELCWFRELSFGIWFGCVFVCNCSLLWKLLNV